MKRTRSPEVANTRLPHDLDELQRMSGGDLAQLWSSRFPRTAMPKARAVALRELAWHLQRSASGGLDAETRLLLRAAMRRAEPGSSADRRRPRRRSPPRRGLPPGTKLIRKWNGRDHEVVIGDDGKSCTFAGDTYRSLTKVALAITGAHWSGPRFFGLTPAPGRKKNNGKS